MSLYCLRIFKKGRNKEETLENYASTSISVQNMSLYAWSKGIGIHWSTGKLSCKIEGLCSKLKVEETSTPVGLLFIWVMKAKTSYLQNQELHLKKNYLVIIRLSNIFISIFYNF